MAEERDVNGKRQGFSETIFESSTDITDRWSNQHLSISNNDQVEQKILTIGEPIAMRLCPKVSAEQVDTHAPIVNKDSYVRSQNIHMSFNEQPTSELDGTSVRKSKPGGMQNEHDIILDSSNAAEIQAEKLAVPKGKITSVKDVDPLVLIEPAMIKKSAEVKSIKPQHSSTDGFENFATREENKTVDTKFSFKASIGRDVEESQSQKEQSHSDYLPPLSPQNILNVMSKNFPAEKGTNKSSKPALKEVMSDNPRDPVNQRRASFIYNSMEEYVAGELSDHLDNCKKRVDNNLMVGLPIEIYLQNTLSTADAQKWITKQNLISDKNVKNVIVKPESTKKLNETSVHNRFRRLSIRMSLGDYEKKVPPYVAKSPTNNIKIKKPKSKFANKSGNQVIIIPSPKKENALVENRYHNERQLISTTNSALSPNKRNFQCEGAMNKSPAGRRFSIFRGELTSDVAKTEFCYTDLLYSHLRDYYSSFPEEELDIRTVIAVARGKVLRRKLHLFQARKHPIHFGLYSDLIYGELHNFFAVIREEEEHVSIMIAVARGKVFQLSSNRKRVLKGTFKSSRVP